MTTSASVRFGRGRCLAIGLCLIAGMAALLVRLAFVQVVDHDRWVACAVRSQLSKIAIPAERGAIYDRNGRPLAVSRDVCSVSADPMLIEQKDLTAGILARALDMPYDNVLARLQRTSRFVWIKRKISDREAEWVRRLDLEGIELKRERLRVYPEGSLACHVLGFVNIDSVGMEGVEARYDKLLRGKDGAAIVRLDGRRHIIADGSTPRVQPQHGHSLVLTLDANVQAICEEELAAACGKWRPESGIAIVLDPWCGEVLAMAVLPNYDPNAFSTSDEASRRNRAITDWFEPGSTFKPFIAGPALQAGVATPGSTFFCQNGVWQVGGRTLHDTHGYGELTLIQIIEKSSNIGISKVAALLGPKRLYQALTAFGFGAPTGIDLSGEVGGLLRPVAQWTGYSMTSIPMGQEIAVTALQLARGFTVFANGGRLVDPHVALAVTSHDGATVEKWFDRSPGERVLGEPVAEIMARQALAGVVERGTGKSAHLAGYAVGGKTGTAQLARVNGRGYEPGAYIGTFVGFAPVEQPRFVVLVSLRRPRGAYYGGTVAAPAVARILERSLAYAGVPPAQVQTAMR